MSFAGAPFEVTARNGSVRKTSARLPSCSKLMPSCKHRAHYGTAELSFSNGAASDWQLHIARAQGTGGGRLSAGIVDPPGLVSGAESVGISVALRARVRAYCSQSRADSAA